MEQVVALIARALAKSFILVLENQAKNLALGVREQEYVSNAVEKANNNHFYMIWE
jgi:hypothetical protein